VLAKKGGWQDRGGVQATEILMEKDHAAAWHGWMEKTHARENAPHHKKAKLEIYSKRREAKKEGD